MSRAVDLSGWAERETAPERHRPFGCYPVEHVQADSVQTTSDGSERRTRCVQHSKCLSFASDMEWMGMSCLDCSVDAEIPNNGEWARDQLHSVIDLWRAIGKTVDREKAERLEKIRAVWTRAKGWHT